jgi:hypothetical protein
MVFVRAGERPAVDQRRHCVLRAVPAWHLRELQSPLHQLPAYESAFLQPMPTTYVGFALQLASTVPRTARNRARCARPDRPVPPAPPAASRAKPASRGALGFLFTHTRALARVCDMSAVVLCCRWPLVRFVRPAKSRWADNQPAFLAVSAPPPASPSARLGACLLICTLPSPSRLVAAHWVARRCSLP